jgi:hypothetical protein
MFAKPWRRSMRSLKPCWWSVPQPLKLT